jgi:hypothetical protein
METLSYCTFVLPVQNPLGKTFAQWVLCPHLATKGNVYFIPLREWDDMGFDISLLDLYKVEYTFG